MRAALRLLFVALTASRVVAAATATAQEAHPPGETLRFLRGIEPAQKIMYVRIFLDGKAIARVGGADLPLTPTAPVLIGQCTQAASGKYQFELLMNFGNVQDTSFHPPWKSSGRDDLFPPRIEKFYMEMEFLGYVKVKPVKRQWDVLLDPYGEYRYTPPSGGSRNLEEIMFYLQYLKALPILRLTSDKGAAQFETAPMLTVLHNEPLCRASGM